MVARLHERGELGQRPVGVLAADVVGPHDLGGHLRDLALAEQLEHLRRALAAEPQQQDRGLLGA